MTRGRGLALAVLAGAALGLAWPMPELPSPPSAPTFLDRNGHELARAGTPGQAHGHAVEAVPEVVALALMAAEDHRFRSHPGVDARAIGRAAAANLSAGEVVQGGSTLTQQLVRTAWPHGGGWSGKLTESWSAVRLELRTDKDTLLLEYANRVYFGRSAWGVGAAAEMFFDKHPETLSLSEAAMLAAMPQRPAAHDPFDHPEAARLARDRVLRRLDELGWADVDDALQTPLTPRSAPVWRDAPHFIRSLDATEPVVQTSLDVRLQRRVEEIVDAQIDALSDRNVTQAAVLVVRRDSAQIVAWVGSADWTAPDGQVDGVLSRRSPGSALKPFVYELALAEGGQTLASVVEDSAGSWSTPHGTWRPQNYDERFLGPMRLREALATSRNLPAVRMLELVGVAELRKRLKQLGFGGLEQRPDHYGLALALGDAEVSLHDLVQGYLALATEGRVRGLTTSLERSEPGPTVLDAEACALILDALDDPTARAAAFGVDSVLEPDFPMAAKTGTSVGWRDNWAVGVTPEHVIGVWVGNFDNSPMRDVSGITGAGPILRQVADLTWTGARTDLTRTALERGPICPDTGLRRGDTCPNVLSERFATGTAPKRRCDHALDTRPDPRILTPDPDSTYYLEGEVLPLTAISGGHELTWTVDGRPVGAGPQVRWVASDGLHEVALEADGVEIARHRVHIASAP